MVTPRAAAAPGFGFMIASDGLSPIAPPWSSLTAYDLNQGSIQWKIPLGDVPELAAKGIKGTGSHYPKVGPVITAGGLVFTGTRDRRIRAFDLETGKIVFEKDPGPPNLSCRNNPEFRPSPQLFGMAP